MYREKTILLDEQALERSLTRISHEIVEKNEDISSLCLVGIRRRGLPLAKRIAARIKSSYGVDVTVEELDVSPFRDDNGSICKQDDPPLKTAVEGKTVVLVDDVLYTGRTVRAAIEAVMLCGRPAAIRLAALIDRGHRDLPIKGDYVGKNVPTSKSEIVAVKLPPIDDGCSVELYEKM